MHRMAPQLRLIKWVSNSSFMHGFDVYHNLHKFRMAAMHKGFGFAVVTYFLDMHCVSLCC